MSFGSRVVGLFPIIYLIGIFGLLHHTLSDYKWYSLILIIFWIYIFPIVCMRLHGLVYKIENGFWDFSENKYHPWWGSYNFQKPFIACPWLESLLHLIPGLFAIWLRAWGSQVGKGVVFTPRVEILDRSLMMIGDYVVIGHMAVFSCHMIIQKESRHFLMIRKISLGSRSFVGAGVHIGPGVEVLPNEVIPAKKTLIWKGELK